MLSGHIVPPSPLVALVAHICHSLMIFTVMSLPLSNHLRSHDLRPAPSHHRLVCPLYRRRMFSPLSYPELLFYPWSSLCSRQKTAANMPPITCILAKRCLDICRRCHEISMPPMPILLYLIPAFHRHVVSLSLIACIIMDGFFIYLSSFSGILTPVCVCSHTLWL